MVVSIKNKSNLLIGVFLILLLINGVGLFVNINKIESANETIIEEVKVSKLFSQMKFLLKDLQEVAAETALVGDPEGLAVLEELKKEYINLSNTIASHHITQMDKTYLNNINQKFDGYFASLKAMAEDGIYGVEAREGSINDMSGFDSAVEKLESTIDGLSGLNTTQLLQLKYNIISIQEILTDALAVGDISGFSDVDALEEETKKLIKGFINTNPKLSTILTELEKNISTMIQNGKSMATKGKTFNEMIAKTNMEMIKVYEYFDTIGSAISAIVQEQEEIFLSSIERNEEILAFSKTVAIILTVLFIIAIVFLSIIIRNILSNVRTLNGGVKKLLTESQVEKVELNTKDELGEIAHDFNAYLDKIQEGIKQDEKIINEARTVISKVNAGLFNDRVTGTASSQGVQRLISEINNMIETSQKNLTILSKTLVALANAKYDYDIPRVEGLTGLVASLFQGAKVTQSTVNEVMALIDNSNKRLTFSAKDLSEAAKELSQSSNQQAAALEQTAAAIEEVSSAIAHSSQSADEMASHAHSVTQSSQTGIELAQKTSTSMDELSSEVSTINDAITIIDQIAFQTNILSLNAAVEAATAGEAGKGFAVVAQEVRNLAARSAEAANEIKALVESANAKAKDGKTVSAEMIEGFNELNGTINTTINLIEDVANASKEQQEAMSQITDTVNALDQATQQNASLASDISNMANSTEELALKLQEAVDQTSFSEQAKRRACNSNMIFQLNQFKSDHINLKNDNFCLCKAGSTFSVKKHTECAFGKWLIENKDSEFAQTEIWETIVDAHKKYHMMIQDTVDLYAEEYENSQIFSVTENVELQANRIFEMIDKLKEHNCDIQFTKRGA